MGCFWIPLFLMMFGLYHQRGNLFQMYCDICQVGKTPSLVNCVTRIRLLLIKHRLKKHPSLGWYERYVLTREVSIYRKLGGKMSYFLCAWEMPTPLKRIHH